MNINDLRHRVTIEKDTGQEDDGYGNKIPDYQPIGTTWAGVKPASGYEADFASTQGVEITHVVKMRYRTDIEKDKHRLIFNGRILEIQYIINKEERNVELQIQCLERPGR